MRKVTYFLCIFISNILSFLSTDVTFGKFEVAKFVTFSFDENEGLNIRGRKLDKLLITIRLPYSAT